ncbi:MAG TPA: DUF1003 domain-containing protein [Candidatus Dormibacteraeota bacterium]|nr:DUF1003 domain-containing protein [Candidatus Dormibacteraeota bacterium]
MTTAATKKAMRRPKFAGEHKHPVNVMHYDEATVGESLADGIAAFLGSWRFLILQTLVVAAWVTINSLEITGKIHIDPYPFILLNLAFSTQAAYTGPVLLLAGNRQAQKDRLTLEHAAAEADKADRQNVQILRAIEHNTEVTVQILEHVEALVEDHISQSEPKSPAT